MASTPSRSRHAIPTEIGSLTPGARPVDDGIGSPKSGKYWPSAKHLVSPSGRGVRSDTTSALCICALCVCGRHKCPSESIHKASFDGESTYSANFKPPPPCPVHGVKPRATPLPSLPFDATSSYTADFPAKEITLRERKAAPPPRESLPFDATSSYASEFGPKEISLRERKAPPPPRETLPFDATTSYSDAFYAKEISLRERKAAPPPRESLPFDATSSYASEFGPKEISLRERKAAPPARESLPFEGMSEHQREYFLKAAPPCPAALLPLPPSHAAQPEAWTQAESGKPHVLWDVDHKKWVERMA